MPGTETKLLQDILSRIDISIMHPATLRTNPVSYSKACDTFRPRIGQGAAIRADLGAKRFVHFFKPRAMLNSLVRQLSSEGRPARIHNGLRHAGLGESGGADVAHRDVIKLTHQLSAELVMKVVSNRVRTDIYCRSAVHPDPGGEAMKKMILFTMVLCLCALAAVQAQAGSHFS